MELVMFSPSVTVYEIFRLTVCMTITLTFTRRANVKCKYTIRKSIGIPSYMLAIVMFAISVTVYDIFTVE